MMAGEKGVVLLDYWVHLYGQRVRIALAEKGVDYEYKEEDHYAVDKSELLLKSNPIYKKLPVLLHDGKPICDSLIIVQYIDEVWSSETPLLPAEPLARANARFWADFIDKRVYDAGSRLWRRKGEEQEAAKKEFIEIFKLFEDELGDKKFFGGETFGFVDLALMPFVAWFYALETCAKFSMEEECPKIVAWGKTCMERESVSKTLTDPMTIYEFMLSVKKNLGLE